MNMKKMSATATAVVMLGGKSYGSCLPMRNKT